MAFNLAQVGVDKKSGAPIIQRSSNFIYNNDPNGTRDIFYYFGSRLRSSSWINPNSTSFLTASRLSGGSITGPAINAVDNNIANALFTNSTNETDGFQAQFLKAPFKLVEIQLNTNDPNWVIEGSNNGNDWVELSYPGFGNLGSNWFLLSITNNAFYSYYRILHGEPGRSKTFNTVKFFGEYQSGDIAPGKTEDATFLATHKPGPGVVYLPDARAENFTENFYTTIVHFKTGEYTYQAFPGGSTPVNDNTNGVLKQGEQLLAVFDDAHWELFKIGSGIDVTTKGTIVTSDGTETNFLPVGADGHFLVADSTQPSGLKYQEVSLNTLSAPTNAVNFAGQRITSLGAPISPSDAVTKNYADSIAAGFDPKASCNLATTGTLNSTTGLTWVAEGNGVGKTLTASGATAVIDTITLQNGFRVLVKDQTNKADNGIYIVSGTGTAVTLTRTTDFDTSTKVTSGAFTFITEGIANGATGFILLGNGTLVIDTNDLVFSQFAGAGAVTVASLPDTNFGTLDSDDTGKFIGWNNSTGFFELYEKAGTNVGDLIKLVDNNGTPAYPPLDGSLINLDVSTVSPLTTKGDLWTYGVADTRLPVGNDGQFLIASSSTGTGLSWKTLSSSNLELSGSITDVTVNFKTGTDSIELGPLHIDDSLSPNTNEFLRYDGTKFIAVDPTGSSTGDLVIIEDVNGTPGLPAIDGSQLTNVTVAQGTGSPLTTKGDIYIYDQNGNSRLPIGSDGQVIVADSSNPNGMKWSDTIPSVAENATLDNSIVVTGDPDLIDTLFVQNGNSNPNGVLLNAGTSPGGTNSPEIVNINRTSVGGNQQLRFGESVYIDLLEGNTLVATGLRYQGSNQTQLQAQASNDGVNWVVLGNFDANGTGSDHSRFLAVTDPNAYRYFRWLVIDGVVSIYEVDMYGTYTTNSLVRVLDDTDLNKLNYLTVAEGATYQLTIPINAGLFNKGDYFSFTNTGKGNVIVTADASVDIIGDLDNLSTFTLINQGDNSWLVYKTPVNVTQPKAKGELVGYSDHPETLDIGTNGQILTVNSNSKLGFRWEDRPGVDDLVYSREIEATTLSVDANDIFKELGAEDPFTYPTSNTTVEFTTNTTDGINDPLSLTSQSFADTFVLNPNAFVAFQFKTISIQPYLLGIYDTQNNASNINVDIEVSKDGTSWIKVGDYVFKAGETGIWNTVNLDTNGYYTHLRLVNKSSSNLSLNEFKLFGWVKDNPKVGQIFAVGSNGITPIKSPTNDLILVSDSSEDAGVKWAALPGTAFDNFRIPIAEETLTDDKTLTATDLAVQVLTPGGENRELILPDSPSKNLYFKIVNADAGNYIISIKETSTGPVVKTLDVDTPFVECHRTATQWIILD